MTPEFARKVARLIVIPCGTDSYHTFDPVSRSTHTVKISRDTFYCDCEGAAYRPKCTHIYRVRHDITTLAVSAKGA